MAQEHSLEVPEGLVSAPEVSGMSRNRPGMSRKVLEASRRSWKVPGSTAHSPAPLALGGKPPRLPWSAKEVGHTKGRESSSRWEYQNLNMAGFRWDGVGRFGRFGSPSWTPHPPYCAPR